VGTDDAELTGWLRDQGSMRVTEALTLPAFGVHYEAATVTCLLPEPYYHQLSFDGESELTAHVTHRWTPNRPRAVHEVVFVVEPDRGPLGAALAYRQWLAERGELVTLAQKMASNPAVDRLRGAIHAYLVDRSDGEVR